MKGRIIGALWIIAALFLTYFTYDGQLFGLLLCCCLLMALGEEAVCVAEPWLSRGSKDLSWAPDVQACVLMLSMFVVINLDAPYLAFVIVVCALSDVGAFTVGKLIGKHKVKFLSGVSPNKSWEGYIAGAIFPVAAIWIAPLFGITHSADIIAYIAIGGILAEVGDLLGSATKRRLAIKDSNEFLLNHRLLRILEYPMMGHGGYLDRLDSFSLSVVGFAIIHNLASLL